MSTGAVVVALVLLASPAEAGRRLVAVRAPAESSGPVEVVLAPPTAPLATSSLDGALVRPPLQGLEESLDLAKMARARVSWTIKADHAWLGRLDERARAGLIAGCAADPAWRVVEEGGVLVAQRRAADALGWVVPRTGYHAGADGSMWRVDLRFGTWGDADPWRTAAGVTRAGPADTALVLRSFAIPGVTTYGARATALSVDGPGVAFDVYELGRADDRARTVHALLELSTQVPPMAWTVAAQLARGEDPRPAGVDAGGAPAVHVDVVDGELDVRGWVNPGVPGWTWVRLVGPSGPWAEDVVGPGTRERIGWSADPSRTAFLQGRFPAPSGAAFAATAEVWVQPDDGSPVRRVAAFPVEVPARGTVVASAQVPAGQ